MSTMTNLFESLNQPRTAMIDAIKGLSEAQLDQKGVVGEWSIKNALAHLNAWERTVTDFLPERVATGARPAILISIGDGEDAWNAQQVALHEHLTPQEQLNVLIHTRQDLLQLLTNFGEDALSRQRPWPEWEGTLAEYVHQGIAEHDQEHCEAIIAALHHLRG